MNVTSVLAAPNAIVGSFANFDVSNWAWVALIAPV